MTAATTSRRAKLEVLAERLLIGGRVQVLDARSRTGEAWARVDGQHGRYENRSRQLAVYVHRR